MELNLNTSQAVVFLPKIELKKGLKKVIVSGRSRMPDPGEYYRKLSNTLENVYYEFNRTLFVEFYFDYINTGSSKWLLSVFRQLECLMQESSGMIEIVWKYDEDDETIHETGELFQSQVLLPVLLKEQ